MLAQRSSSQSFPVHRYTTPTQTSYQEIPKNDTYSLQTSRMVFDPESSTPPSDFVKSLTQRMGVYFDTSDKQRSSFKENLAYNANNWLQK